MPSTPVTSLTASYVVLATHNIDTDQIIPARFLTTTERTGLGVAAFADWRYRPDGTPDPEFVLNRPAAGAAQVLVTGRNFGCGSSREHAVWALLDAGIRAVISTEFADIFRSNALGNGLLPVQVDPWAVSRLIAAAPDGVGDPLSIDVASQALTLPDGRTTTFPIAPFAKHCLLHGIDEMDFLLGASNEILAYERANPARVSTCLAAPGTDA